MEGDEVKVRDLTGKIKEKDPLEHIRELKLAILKQALIFLQVTETALKKWIELEEQLHKK